MALWPSSRTPPAWAAPTDAHADPAGRLMDAPLCRLAVLLLDLREGRLSDGPSQLAAFARLLQQVGGSHAAAAELQVRVPTAAALPVQPAVALPSAAQHAQEGRAMSEAAGLSDVLGLQPLQRDGGSELMARSVPLVLFQQEGCHLLPAFAATTPTTRDRNAFVRRNLKSERFSCVRSVSP